MTVTPASIASGTLAADPPVLMMTPIAANQAVITGAVFSNTSSDSQTITINVVRSGGGAGDGNTVIQAQTIPPNGTFVSPELANMVLNLGDALWGFCGTAGAVNFIISGWTLD